MTGTGPDAGGPPWPAPRPASRVSWAQLLAHPDVVEDGHLASTFGFMAFHGGLEAGTLELAWAAADAAGASWYTVAQPPDLRWHVPSSAVDPDQSPLLERFLGHVDMVIALHGYGRRGRPYDILVGGSNRVLARAVAAELAARDTRFTTTTDLDAIPRDLRGLHPANPVNRPRRAGAQVELPVRARRGPPGEPLVAALAAAAHRVEARNPEGPTCSSPAGPRAAADEAPPSP